MILSKVRLRKSPGAQGALARILLNGSAGDRGHSLVWSLFSETGEEKRREGAGAPLFLFREIEPGAYLIVSQRPPAGPPGLWEIEHKGYAPALSSGQRLGFTLRANPVMAAKRAGAKRGVRTDAVMHAKFTVGKMERGKVPVEAVALDWLYKREAALGVRFDRERCTAGGYRQVRIHHVREGSAGGVGAPRRVQETIVFSEVDYEGVLTVVDPAKLVDALYAGVGKAKAYGCGLLLVRPA